MVKSKSKSKTKSKSKSLKSSKQSQIINIFEKLSSSRNNIAKSRNNLPAKIMELNGQETTSKSYSKSVSSTYSQVMHDGHIHTEGKQVINDSTKPFVLINEMQNGSVQHYMMPKNNIIVSGVSGVSEKTKKIQKSKKSNKNKKSKSKKNMKNNKSKKINKSRN